MVLHARTAIYAFFALFGRCRFCFCFCSCFVVIGSVTNLFLQCTRSIRWQLGLAFRFRKLSFSTFLRWWNAIPQDVSVTYHRKIQFSSRLQTKETTTGISTALAHALTTRSGKRKRLDVSGSPSRVQTYLIVWIIFVDFKNDTSHEALPPTCNMRKITSKTGHNFIRKRTNSFGYELQFVKFVWQLHVYACTRPSVSTTATFLRFADAWTRAPCRSVSAP